MTDTRTLAYLAARPLDLRRANDAGQIEGLASPYGGEPDDFGDIVQPGAFAASIQRQKAQGRLPAMLWHHDMGRPVGRWTDFVETAEGLVARGQLNLSTAAGVEAHAHLKAGDVTGLSIGFHAVQRKGNLLVEANLVEVSLVTIPAADRARVREVRSLASRAELRDLLIDQGLPRGAADKLSRGGWPALTGPSLDPEDAAAIAHELRAIRDLWRA